jgi:hypothetical protein
MNLCQLKWACKRYGELGARYDATLRDFRKCVAPSLDPELPRHRACLFKWLNSWQCRQFALAHHTKTASPSLVHWANVWLTQLPSPDVLLTDLSPDEIRGCVNAYEALRGEMASFKNRGGALVPVSFGDTGAAKVLFGFRPMVFAPWDERIRKEFGFKRGEIGSFDAYLLGVAAQLQSLAREADAPVSELPRRVERPDSSPPKLIDEYNWVTITMGMRPPC